VSNRNVIVLLVLLAAAAWWFLREDPEAEVRKAHQELSRLLSKDEGQTTAAILLDAHKLKGLFAESCRIRGAAGSLVRDYTPDEMVSTALQIQGQFHSVSLTFDELLVEFPETNIAFARFTAVLVGQSKIEGDEEVAETREVASRLQRSNGDWLFVEFQLSNAREK